MEGFLLAFDSLPCPMMGGLSDINVRLPSKRQKGKLSGVSSGGAIKEAIVCDSKNSDR